MRSENSEGPTAGLWNQDSRAQVGNWPLFGNSLICLSFFFPFLDGNFGKFIVRLCYLRLFLMLVKFIGD